jgi:hypothetical protein
MIVPLINSNFIVIVACILQNRNTILQWLPRSLVDLSRLLYNNMRQIVKSNSVPVGCYRANFTAEIAESAKNAEDSAICVFSAVK